MDIFIISAFLNTIWYIVTLLLFIYKFTSLFSYLYNFVKFIGKLYSFLINVCKNIYDYIRQKRGYIKIGTEETEYILPQNRNDIDNKSDVSEETTPASFFEKFTKSIAVGYNYCYGKLFHNKVKTDYTPDIEHILIDKITTGNSNSNVNTKNQKLSKNILQQLDQSYEPLKYSNYYNYQNDDNRSVYTEDSGDTNFNLIDFHSKENIKPNRSVHLDKEFLNSKFGNKILDSNLLLQSLFINQQLDKNENTDIHVNVELTNSQEHPLMN